MSSNDIYSLTDYLEKTKEERCYYVYVYRDPTTDEPFYVGKGTGNRAYDHIRECTHRNVESYRGYNALKTNKIRKILKSGVEPIIDFPKENLTEQEAFELEEIIISEVGRRNRKEGPLTNMTDGGEGNRGLRYCLDDKIYTIYNQYGETYTGTRLEIREDIIGNHQTTAGLFRDGWAKGWSLTKEDFPDKLHVPRDKCYELYSIEKNEVIPISKESCLDYGISIDGFLELIRKKKNAKVRGNFCLKENIEYGKEIHNKMYVKHTFTNIKTLKTVDMTIHELYELTGVLSKTIRQMIDGDREHCGMWVFGDYVDYNTRVRWDEDMIHHIVNVHSGKEMHLTKEEVKTQIMPKNRAAVASMLRGETCLKGWRLAD